MTLAPPMAAGGGLRFEETPLDPTAPEARDLVLRELAKPEYTAAKPTWFDRAASAFWDWLNSLQFGDVSGPPAVGILVLVVIVAAGLLTAFLVFGIPRLNRRSAVAGDLFGRSDERTAAQLRTAAGTAAARGDYTLAIEELFRAIARGLAERTLVAVDPGTTAQEFAVRAGLVFPALGDALADAARTFDDVRYLGGSGDREAWDAIASLESTLRATRAAEGIPS